MQVWSGCAGSWRSAGGGGGGDGEGGGGQMVKPLKNVDLFTFGGQMDSLKKKPSKLIYFECRFDVNLFL